jgi:xanthine dehydrogenase YagR molybdenum-binding subunit
MITFELNGKSFSTAAAADTALIDVIRGGARLTGTKQVCGAGVCGACTVKIDGEAVVSCLTPLANVANRRVETIESLDAGGALHPVQRAFMAEDALQCGFCTPGFVVAAAHFHDAWRATHGTQRPDDATIGAALSGHLCRCGAYAGIYRAVAAACTGAFDGSDAASSRVEAREKVTGRAVYTVDVATADMLHGTILRSRHAHAVIVDLDLAPARAVEGVQSAVSLLEADMTVRYAGQEIAAVAARTRDAAVAACAAITLRYDIKSAVILPAAATASGAPLVYPGWRKSPPNAAEGPLLPMTWSGNRRGPANSFSLNRSAAKRTLVAARAARSKNLVDLTFYCDGQSHTCLEPHAAVVHVTGNSATVHASTQAPQFLAERVKALAGVGSVVVIAPHVGGGFGSKVGLGVERRWLLPRLPANLCGSRLSAPRS